METCRRGGPNARPETRLPRIGIGVEAAHSVWNKLITDYGSLIGDHWDGLIRYQLPTCRVIVTV
jgi:hypothetical protein